MIIKQLQLENIRSYRQIDLSFNKGMTYIIGKNGAGKSSIIRAIGFGLFDHLVGTLDQLLRKGTLKGRIAIRFAFTPDGEEYLVTRVIEHQKTGFKADRWLVYAGREEDPARILKQKEKEIKTWLQEQLDLDPTMRVDNCFEQIIGVPQNTLVSAFTLHGKQRENLFNQVFNLQKYKVRAQKISPIEQTIKRTLEELNNELSELKGQISQLKLQTPRLKELQTELKQLTLSLAEVKAKIGQLELKRREYEHLLQTLQAIQKEMQMLTTVLPQIQSQLETARGDHSKATLAVAFLTENATRFETFNRIVKELSELEKKLSERNQLIRECAEIEKLHSQKSGELVSRQQTFDSQSIELEQETRAVTERLQSLKQNLEAVTELLAGQQKILTACEALQNVIQDLEKQQLAYETRIQSTRQVLESQNKQVTESEQATAQMQTLFPLFQEFKDAETKRNQLQKQREIVFKKSKQLAVLQSKEEQLTNQIKEWNREVNGLQEQLSGMPQIQKMVSEFDLLEKEIGELQHLAGQITPLKKRITELQKELVELELSHSEITQTLTQMKLQSIAMMTEEIASERTRLEHFQHDVASTESALEIRTKPAEGSEGRTCPFGLGECLNLPEQTTFPEYFAGEHSRLAALIQERSHQIECSKKCIQELETQYSEMLTLHHQHESLQQKLNQILIQQKLTSETLQEKENELQFLETQQQRLVLCQNAIKEMGNPKSQLALLNDKQRECDRLTRLLAKATSEIAQLAVERVTVQADINKFGNLDEALQQVEVILADPSIRAAVDHYAIAKHTAGLLNERIEIRDQQVEMLNALISLCERGNEQLKLKKLQYDVHEHNAIKETVQSTQQQATSLKTELKETENQSNLLKSKEKKLSQEKSRLEKLQSELKSMARMINEKQKTIQMSDGIEEHIESNRKIKNEETEFEREYRNQRSILNSLGNDVQTLCSRVQNLERDVQQRQNRIEELQGLDTIHRANFNEEEFEHVKHEHVGQMQLEAGLTERRLNITEEIQRLQVKVQELIKLKEIEKELKQKHAKYNQLRKLLQITRLHILERAGAKVVEQNLRIISKRANTIFKTIRPEFNEELEWASGYEVRLMKPDHELLIMDDLSGGEQMAAALAIRIALLQTLTGIKLGFFDEPTNNLDVEKRISLAHSLRNVELIDFHQLFVISHEEAFASATQNVILLDKDEDGNSRFMSNR